jgi:uncharacterized DUF497 family protein
MIIYDETKRQTNLQKRGLDFEGCESIFDYPVVSWKDDRAFYGEQRINVLGFLDGQIVRMTYTERGDDWRVISLRKATKDENRYYAKTLSRQP